jgi:hypothetical protein
MLDHDCRVLITLLHTTGLTHSKLAFLWQKTNKEFGKTVCDVFTRFLGRFSAKPVALKLPSFSKLICDYFNEKATPISSDDVDFPYCVWAGYRDLADRFVDHFSSDLALPICQAEAEMLVNALLTAGIISNLDIHYLISHLILLITFFFLD